MVIMTVSTMSGLKLWLYHFLGEQLWTNYLNELRFLIYRMEVNQHLPVIYRDLMS